MSLVLCLVGVHQAVGKLDKLVDGINSVKGSGVNPEPHMDFIGLTGSGIQMIKDFHKITVIFLGLFCGVSAADLCGNELIAAEPGADHAARIFLQPR